MQIFKLKLNQLDNGQKSLSFLISMPANVSIKLYGSGKREYYLVQNTTLQSGYHSFSLSSSLNDFSTIEIDAKAIYSLSNEVSELIPLK